MALPQQPRVALHGITKRYPGVTANDDVSLTFRAGEVHVLLGENGAGKSTLVGLLSGLRQPDAGTIAIDGRVEIIASPRRALALGIGAVFQHSMLVPSLSLVDTMALGGSWWRTLDRAGLARRLRAIGQDLGITLDPYAIVGSLSFGERQQVEIVRALLRGSRVLVLDEPTAMLTPTGAADLGRVMRHLAARGLAVVFITHKLDEALAYGDRISVLRRGRMVGDFDSVRLRALDATTATAEIVRLMFGPDATAGDRPRPSAIRPARTFGKTVLSVEGLGVADPVAPVAGITLSVAAGEILGIAGIDGNGQKQLVEALAGQRAAQGTILLDGRPIERLDVAARRALGLRYVTDDRLGEGTLPAFPVATNLVLKDIGEPPSWRGGWERPAAIAANARTLVAAFDIRTPSIDTPVGRLSGGNVQKTVLARELAGRARAAIFAKPTAGLDRQSAAATRSRIREAAEGGMAVLLVSTDLAELLDLSDRVAVMVKGRIVGTVPNDDEVRQRVGTLMSGTAA